MLACWQRDLNRRPPFGSISNSLCEHLETLADDKYDYLMPTGGYAKLWREEDGQEKQAEEHDPFNDNASS